jgi:4-alpha-glucanotransferase
VTLLRALGADLSPALAGDPAAVSAAHLTPALEARRRELGRRLLEPVLVAWEGRAEPLHVRMPAGYGVGSRGARAATTVRLTLWLEDGSSAVAEVDAAALQTREDPLLLGWRTHVVPATVWAGMANTVDGAEGRTGRRLPLGYHRLLVEAAGEMGEALVISAPRRCYSSSELDSRGEGEPPKWGVFSPLYALRSPRDWGAGDVAELRGLAEQVHAAGGWAVATLPLLAAYLDDPFEPAPYRPVSRLFWNEFFLAPELIPGFGSCAAARRFWDSPGLQQKLAALRAGALVDYKETMALKRAVLEEAAACFFAAGGDRSSTAYRSYVSAHPEANDYAVFRARVQACRADWRDWPEEGAAGAGDATAADAVLSGVARYHLYCQWQMDEQLAALAASPTAAGLLLDLPVGAHPGGYDTWRWRHLFAHGVSTGAPPDDFFALGQDWDFPPLHPDRVREAGHQYFAACLRHHMSYADLLRVDHMMGLHRIYVIPAGSSATDGAYLRYPADELYAVLALESVRNRTVVVGEDLGTVPAGVRSTMNRRGVKRTWVMQLSLRPRGATPVRAIPARSLASLNTHDMSPFAGYLLGRDIEARVETGQLTAGEAARQRKTRGQVAARLTRLLFPAGIDHERPAAALLHAALRYLARSSAGLVVVSAEDLLLETEPQNLPGTGAERPNWKRRLRGGQEELAAAIVRAADWLRPGDAAEGR